LKEWHELILKLEAIEQKYFWLEASEKSLFAELYNQSEAKNIKDKECLVYASDKWKSFKKGLCQAKTEHNKAMRELELRKKQIDFDYLNMKRSGGL